MEKQTSCSNMLSIIIPCFNSYKSLKRLLETIPFKDDLEVIVVDDKSEKELNILAELKLSYANHKVLFLKNNSEKKGAGVARNLGIAKAKGKWLLFADADDYFVNDLYSIVSPYFNSSYDVIFFTPTSRYLDNKREASRHKSYKKLIQEYLNNKSLENEIKLRYLYFSPCSKLIRKEFILKHQIFFDECLFANDVMFSAKVGYYLKTFQASEETFYCITHQKGSSTTKVNNEALLCRANVYLRYCLFLQAKLPESQKKYLDLSAKPFLLKAIKTKQNIKTIIEFCNLFRKQGVPLIKFNIKYLNPIFIISRIIFHFRLYKRNKAFYEK